MTTEQFVLTPTYGKQSVPVFKLSKKGPNHTVIDMVVKVMLEGDMAASWLTGENHQILPTETQKNTCYVVALKNEFDCVEDFSLALARDLMSRHQHISKVTIEGIERVWSRVNVGGKPHNHVFTSAKSPVTRTSLLVLPRNGLPHFTSGIANIKLMKTTQSGFLGYIRDEYTNLQPVGEGPASVSPDRIMCTDMVGHWKFTPGRAPEGKFAGLNARVLETLVDVFSGDPETGVFSKSLQQTAYRMAGTVLKLFPEIDEVTLECPNVHFYRYDLEQFGLSNPNIVFQSTDSQSTASGRIVTVLSRKPNAKL
jgi:urate oxidase